MRKKKLIQFLSKLKTLPRVIIQAHDFPDHDAVSASYALSHILTSLNIENIIVYNGNIDRISLSNMIVWLNIPIFHCSKVTLTSNDHIITVDGCIGEKNVTDMPGQEIAVIDHHQVTPPATIWYSDVRPHYGATATILYEYYTLLELDIPQQIATALLVGLNIDTANLTRGFCQADIQAFMAFNQIADLEEVNKISRNSLLQEELAKFEHICKSVESINGIAITLIKERCAKNLLGVLADFLLTVNEFDIIIVAMQHEQGIQLSLRSECPKVNVGQLLRETLNYKQFGFGGGHAHMAGGIILPDKIHHFINQQKAHFSPLTEKIIHLRK